MPAGNYGNAIYIIALTQHAAVRMKGSTYHARSPGQEEWSGADSHSLGTGG